MRYMFIFLGLMVALSIYNKYGTEHHGKSYHQECVEAATYAELNSRAEGYAAMPPATDHC